ncbi:MAG TPA: MaoC/PaaZ C-terminal domain-containing protein [Xanthomonadales bacterium]|nr:MaoC/PaaZ C-terminal domain-containing protein [Xanthomonadales bacterium]
MAIDPEKLLNLRLPTRARHYSRQDARLYALSVGFGSDPMMEPELDFASDRKGFKTVPTMASIFADVILDLTLACELKRPELALHGQQMLEMFAPLPDAATLEISGTIPAIYDRGETHGAEIHMQAEARLQGSDEPLYLATYVTIARGDGGFGGTAPPRDSLRKRVPDRAADQRFEFQTQPNQALVYSLNGDPNPIHTQPRIALKAGFDRPILHGLCTYGLAYRALMSSCRDYNSANTKRFDVRFSAPVTPGDRLAFEFWEIGEGIAFQASSQREGRLVLKEGFYQQH